jgi:hypothetical protein
MREMFVAIIERERSIQNWFMQFDLIGLHLARPRSDSGLVFEALADWQRPVSQMRYLEA